MQSTKRSRYALLTPDQERAIRIEAILVAAEAFGEIEVLPRAARRLHRELFPKADHNSAVRAALARQILHEMQRAIANPEGYCTAVLESFGTEFDPNEPYVRHRTVQVSTIRQPLAGNLPQ